MSDARSVDVAANVDLENQSVDEAIDELLSLVREGRTHLDELTDSLGITAVKAEELVRAAEQTGLVVRPGYSGMNLYTVELTTAGESRLPELSPREQALAEHDMNDRDYRVLQIVADRGKSSTKEILSALDENLAPMKLIPVVNHLVQEGYLAESGLWRRYVTVTDTGQQALGALSELDEESPADPESSEH